MAPSIASWWFTSCQPFVFLKRARENKMFGLAILKPQRLDTSNFLSMELDNSLCVMQNINVDDDWEQPWFRQEHIPALLSHCSGCHPVGRLDEPEVAVDIAVLAMGIVYRLQSQIPVLLLGDLDTGMDTRIALLLSNMLGRTHVVIDSGEFALHKFEKVAEESRLLLAQCSRNVLFAEDHGELDFLQSLLLDPSSEVDWLLASMHYSGSSALELQLQLPPALRRAAVFC